MYRIEQTEYFARWLRRIRDAQTRVRIIRRIERMAEGNLGDVKRLNDVVWEARLFFGSGYRLYFTMRAEHIILLLCGGDKSGQQQDIELANRLAKQVETDHDSIL